MRTSILTALTVVTLVGCAEPSKRTSFEPPCFRNEPIYFKKPDPLFDPPAATHYSYHCGEAKVAVVRGPRKTEDVFGVKHLKQGSYQCINIPLGTVPHCLGR